MTGILKFALGILVGGALVIALIVFGLLRGVEKVANGTVAEVAGAADRIASFTLPEGYRPEYTVSLAGYTIAAYSPKDGHSHLFLVQAPSGTDIDQAKLEEALNQAPTGQKVKNARLTVIEKRAVTIRGQQATLVISEGTNSSGETYRQAEAAFQGKGGPALLVISEPLSRWNMERVLEFVRSVK